MLEYLLTLSRKTIAFISVCGTFIVIHSQKLKKGCLLVQDVKSYVYALYTKCYFTMHLKQNVR